MSGPRKNYHKLLQEYQYALDASAIVAMTDSRGTITYVNDMFCQISKFSREELIGANHSIVNSGYHPRTFFTEMFRTLAQEGIWHGEICNRAKDGSIYWVDTTIVAMRHGGAKIAQYIAIRYDITERKRIEAQLLDTNNAMAAKNQEMEQYSYTVSHNLKSPLTSCMGLLNALEEDLGSQPGSSAGDLIERIRGNILKMTQRINDLLEFSRIGRVQHERKWIDMNELTHGVVSGFGDRAATRGAQIRIMENMPRVYADPVWVGEVFENLIANALKYGCGGPMPEIELGWVREGYRVRYYVKDNGQGIPRDEHEKIFTMFHRLSQANPDEPGTGIGLAIVQRIMETHGGRVWLESDESRGATFWLQFDHAGIGPGDADDSGDPIKLAA